MPEPESAPEPEQPKRAARKRRTKGAQPKPRASEQKATAPTDGEREERNKQITDRQRQVLELAQRSEGVRPAEVAEKLDIRVESAADLLKRMSRRAGLLRREELVPGYPRRGVVYFAKTSPITKTDEEGAKTSVERRVVQIVRADEPIDKGTLAFKSKLSISDLGSVAAGLCRRGVLKTWEEDGVRLYGRGGVMLDDERR